MCMVSLSITEKMEQKKRKKRTENVILIHVQLQVWEFLNEIEARRKENPLRLKQKHYSQTFLNQNQLQISISHKLNELFNRQRSPFSKNCQKGTEKPV